MAPVSYRARIKDLPPRERPRERLTELGPRALSTAELIAILLETGTRKDNALSLAGEIVAKYGLRKLSGISARELTSLNGVGSAKAAKILAALELGKRAASHESDSRNPKVENARDVFRLLYLEFKDAKKERVKALYLNSRNRLLRIEELFVGCLDATLIHPREVFGPALLEGAAALVLVHNHPSDDPKPSREDVKFTEKLVEAGNLLGIQVLDHVVIGGNRFFSMREKKLLE